MYMKTLDLQLPILWRFFFDTLNTLKLGSRKFEYKISFTTKRTKSHFTHKKQLPQQLYKTDENMRGYNVKS